MAYGNDFSAVMQADLAERAMMNAKGEAAMNRFVNVMAQRGQLNQAKQAGMQQAQQAMRQLQMQQANLDTQKAQFAQTFQQGAQQFEAVNAHNKWVQEKTLEELGIKKDQFSQELLYKNRELDYRKDALKAGGPAYQMQIGLMKQGEAQAENGEFDPDAWQEHVKAGRMAPEEVKRLSEVSRQQFGQRMAQYDQDSSIANLMTKESKLRESMTRQFPAGKPKEWWLGGSQKAYDETKTQLDNLSAIIQPYRDDVKNFSDRFVPVQTKDGVTFRPAMAKPQPFGRQAGQAAPPSTEQQGPPVPQGPGNPYFASKFITTDSPPSSVAVIPAGSNQFPGSAAPSAPAATGWKPEALAKGWTPELLARMPKVTTREELARLPSGTTYMPPSGMPAMKP